MTDKDYRPFLQIQDAFRCGDIIRETRQRFLDDTDAVTILFEDVMNRTPTLNHRRRRHGQ
jgi:hypothetical protein